MASPTVQDVTENSTNSAGTNHTINHPTVVAGQLWILILDKGSTAATVNAHALWTELLDENSANGLYIAYRWTDGSEGASSTLVTSASTRSASHLYRITGAENPATQAPQIGTTSSGTSATPDPPASATPGSSKDYLFIAFYGAAGEEADDDTWSDTPPTNYTPSPPRQKSCGTAGTNLGGLIASASRALTTGSAENPGTFAKDVSAAWRAQTIMVHPIGDIVVTPGAASLTTTRFTPTVTLTDPVVVTPGAASLALTAFAPTVTVQVTVTVTPGTATLTTSRFTPTVQVNSPVIVTPGVASLVLTAYVIAVLIEGGAEVLIGKAMRWFEDDRSRLRWRAVNRLQFGYGCVNYTYSADHAAGEPCISVIARLAGSSANRELDGEQALVWGDVIGALYEGRGLGIKATDHLEGESCVEALRRLT